MRRYSKRLYNLSDNLRYSNSNIICRVCLSSLFTFDEISREVCMDCREYNLSDRYSKNRNSIMLKIDRDSIISTGLTSAKIDDSMNFITNLFSILKQKVIENSENLKNTLDITMNPKIEEARNSRDLVNTKILELKKSAKNQIHLINIPTDNKSGIILNDLLQKKNNDIFRVLKYRINSNQILEKIKKPALLTPYKIEALISEPEIKYFISRPLFRMRKFKIFSKSFEEVPILNAKDFDWPENGIFIEYQENLFLFAGRVGIFFSKELVWNLDSSSESINAIQVGNFPKRENYTLEYLDPNIYIFGGNSKEIQYFSLNNENDRRTLMNLPEEIGYSHSVRIGETVILVGAKSKNVYRYFIKENKLETDYNQFFTKGQNKCVFDFDGKELVFANSQVIWKGEILGQTIDSFSGFKCAGKGKIVYSYLYFVTYNEKFESTVWRLCLKSFQLNKF